MLKTHRYRLAVDVEIGEGVLKVLDIVVSRVYETPKKYTFMDKTNHQSEPRDAIWEKLDEIVL